MRQAGRASPLLRRFSTNSNSVFVFCLKRTAFNPSRRFCTVTASDGISCAVKCRKRFDPLPANECSLNVVFASTFVKVLQRLNPVVPLSAVLEAFNALKTS